MKLTKSDHKGGSYPALAQGFESWVCWMEIDGRKQPFAPYSDLPRSCDDGPDKFGWSNPANLTSFETARDWARKHPNLKGVGFIVQDQADPYKEPADPLVLVDFDDVIADDGTIHPYVAMLIDRIGTYGDVSVSGTGIHFIGVGQLPEGVRTIQDELPEHPEFPNAEIEVYDGKRFCAMSGRWLKRTPRDVADITPWLRRFTRRFSTQQATKSTGDAGRSVDVDNSAYADVETTDNFDEVLDAIDSVGRHNITLRSTETRERADGVIDYDPSYRKSESGTGLAWFPKQGVWCDRNGQKYMNALQLVAVEESLKNPAPEDHYKEWLEIEPGEYPEGDTFWKAVERLRERGANIPRYTGSETDLFKVHKTPEDEDEEAKQFMKQIEML